MRWLEKFILEKLWTKRKKSIFNFLFLIKIFDKIQKYIESYCNWKPAKPKIKTETIPVKTITVLNILSIVVPFKDLIEKLIFEFIKIQKIAKSIKLLFEARIGFKNMKFEDSINGCKEPKKLPLLEQVNPWNLYSFYYLHQD